MHKHTDSNPDLVWAQARVIELIKTCRERADLVLSWTDEILDEWL